MSTAHFHIFLHYKCIFFIFYEQYNNSLKTKVNNMKMNIKKRKMIVKKKLK